MRGPPSSSVGTEGRAFEEIAQLKALLRVEPNISHRGVPPVYVHTSSSVVDALSATNRVPTATIRPIPVEANLVAHQCNSHPAASSPRARRRRHRDSLPFPACRVAGRDICHGWGWDPYIGRVGGLTVALGVGAAIAAGWGSGLAWVDDAGRSSESAASATDSGAGPRRRSAVQPAALITGLRSRSNSGEGWHRHRQRKCRRARRAQRGAAGDSGVTDR